MNSQSTDLLSATGLSIGYSSSREQVLCLPSLKLKLQAGQFVCLLGANGSGKSSLLRTLAGIQKPLSGVIKIEGSPLRDLAPRERAHRFSLVETQPSRNTSLYAYDYVALGRQPYSNWFGKLNAQDHQKIKDALLVVDAMHLAQRPVCELSDGESQRVALARALAQEVNIFLMDEPTAFLDIGGRVELMQTLRNMTHQSRLGTVLSTHDLDLALRYADQIWLLTKEKTLEQGIPEELVLNGRIRETFSNEQQLWDLESGRSETTQVDQPQISIQASGREKMWTQRALERSGIGSNALPGSVRFHLSIVASDNGFKWVLKDSKKTITLQLKSITECVEQLKNLMRMTTD